jgi:hypothetical protein
MKRISRRGGWGRYAPWILNFAEINQPVSLASAKLAPFNGEPNYKTFSPLCNNLNSAGRARCLLQGSAAVSRGFAISRQNQL